MLKSRVSSFLQSEWLIFFFIGILNFILKLPYFSLPVNRDTGTFLYAGQEIIRGKIIYLDFFDHKPPLSYVFGALFVLISNNSIFLIRIFILITVIISAFLVFKLGYKLTNSRIYGFFSGILYSLFISMPFTWSFDFLTTNFMEIFGLLSIFFILNNESSWNYLFSGIMVGLSALSKPPGILYLPIILLIILIREPKNKKRSTIYPFIGLGFISVIIALFLQRYNVMSEFIYWTILRNVSLHAVPFSSKLSVFCATVLRDNFLLYILALCSILSTIAYYKSGRNSDRETIILCAFWIFLFAGLYSVTPQIQPHYFLSLIAPLSIIGANFVEKLYGNKKLFLVFFLIFLSLFCVNYEVQVHHFSSYIVSSATGLDLKEQTQISSDIMNLTNSDEKILVLFSSPEYYYLSNRESSTPYPQLNGNYLSKKEKNEVLNNLLSQKSQKVILVRYNDWESFNISPLGLDRDYSLYKTYRNASLYILKNNNETL